LALLKAPSKQPKTTTLQVRLEEGVRNNLDRYAEFIDANPSYVVSEALKLLFRRMRSSNAGQANTPATTTNSKSREGHIQSQSNKYEVAFNAIRCAREYSVLRTACPAPCS
jgi:hypothetical protein